MEPYSYFVVTGVAYALSVFCSIAEGALLSFSRVKLDERLKDPARKERIEAYLEQADSYLFSSIVLNAISDVVLVFCLTLGFLAGEVGPRGALYALVTSLAVVVVFAEVVPRAFAARYAESLVPKVLPPIALLTRVLFPIMVPLQMLDRGLLRLLGEDPKARRAAEIVDEIRSAAMEGEREGVLGEDEAAMIESVIEFRDAEVLEIMTPRKEMVSLEVHAPIRDAVKIALEKGLSRVPVYEGTRDRIVGILYAKDLFHYWGKPDSARVAAPAPSAAAPGDARSDSARAAAAGAAGATGGGGSAGDGLRPLLRKPFFVPLTKQSGELLREMRAKKMHIAIVLDEYGGTAGLVTIEDIIEEIIGEIDDEYDVPGPGAAEELPPLTRVSESVAEVDAKLHVDDLNELLGLGLPEDGQYETVGGFLFASMGKVPKKGETFVHENVEFTVLDADERRIQRVRVAVGPTADGAPA